MPVLTMPLKEAGSHRTPPLRPHLTSRLTSDISSHPSHQLLSATLRELCRFLASFPNLRMPNFQMNEPESTALAAAAIDGHPEAEFTVASIFDAAGHPARATEWYHRSAGRDYLPAMLQLTALR